jgi:hypothetical protein
MQLYILDKSDSWLIIMDKLREEHDEALTAINNLYKFEIKNNPNDFETKDLLSHEAASEILDIIQVSIGALDKLFLEKKIDMSEEINIHNRKLRNRGWLTRGIIHMNANYYRKKIV